MVRIAGIEYDSIVDGPELRTAIFVQGCKHQCKGCHNPQTWDFDGGTEISTSELIEKIKKNSINKNITLTGGDPIYQWMELYPLVEELRKDDYSFMLYTGFTVSELIHPLDSKILSIKSYLHTIEDMYYRFVTNMRLVCTDPFIESRKDENLLFRGSNNQCLGRFVYNKDDTISFVDMTRQFAK